MDIVERLRDLGDHASFEPHMHHEAADEIERLRQQNAELMDLLEELHAQVWGECPSLLNEDSGGDGDLDLRIQAAIAKATGGE